MDISRESFFLFTVKRRYINRFSKFKNCVRFLEKREMLSATAEDAAVDWINEQVITEVSTNLNLSENDIVKVGGTNLSINDLINGSFVLT